MLRARMFRSLIPVLMIKERNIRARNITIQPLVALLIYLTGGGDASQANLLKKALLYRIYTMEPKASFV